MVKTCSFWSFLFRLDLAFPGVRLRSDRDLKRFAVALSDGRGSGETADAVVNSALKAWVWVSHGGVQLAMGVAGVAPKIAGGLENHGKIPVRKKRLDELGVPPWIDKMHMWRVFWKSFLGYPQSSSDSWDSFSIQSQVFFSG